MAHDGSERCSRGTPAKGEDEEGIEEHISTEPEDGDTEGRPTIPNGIVEPCQRGRQIDTWEAQEREVEVAQPLGTYTRRQGIEVKEEARP